MNIRDWLLEAGYLQNPQGSKACCPFHDDSSPSAKIHDESNTIYCFGCHRVYGPRDFYTKFGAVIDVIQEYTRPPTLESEYEWGEPIFYA